MKSRRRPWAAARVCFVVVVVAATAVAVAACGSSSSSSTSETTSPASGGNGETKTSSEGGNVSIDLGNQKVEVKKGTPKIGLFVYGLSKLEFAYKEEAERLNKEGADVTYIEAKYEAPLQLKQLQTALTNNEYEAWIVESIDPEGTCRVLTEQAPEAGIPVSTITQSICGRFTEPEGKTWSPGTLNFIGTNNNVTEMSAGIEEQLKAMGVTSSSNVAVINGPSITAAAQGFSKAIELAGLEATEEVEGDFTAPTAQKLTQAILSRDSGVEAILTDFEGVTPGVVAALKEAGKEPGEVKLCDQGGSKEITVPTIESGWLTCSMAYAPQVLIKTAVEQMDNAFQGKQGPTELSAQPKGGTPAKPLVVTKENVGTFEPEY